MISIYFVIGASIIVGSVALGIVDAIRARRARSAAVDQAIEFWAEVNTRGVARHLPIYAQTVKDLAIAAEKAQAQENAYRIAFADPDETQEIPAEEMQEILDGADR